MLKRWFTQNGRNLSPKIQLPMKFMADTTTANAKHMTGANNDLARSAT